MAGNRIKGITIEIGGNTTKLTDSLKSVDKSLKDTQSKLKDVNKLLKMDPSNVELLRQKHDLLTKAVEDTKKRQEELKKALENAKNAGDTKYSQEQQDALQRELIETTQQLKNLQEESKKFGSVGAQQAAVFGEKLKDAGGKISGVGKDLTVSATAPITAFFTLAANGASDLEENLNKVDVAFGKDAGTVKQWAENATNQFGLSKNAALEAASLFGDMGTAMGLTTGDAAKMSTELAGLAGDLSSFKNIDVDVAMNALKGVFTGETESLKSLGIIMNQTNLKAFADDLGLVYDEMSQAELVNLRYNYVLEATKNAQGDYARTSDGTANSIRTLEATLSNLTAELGSALLPIITPIIQKLTEWAKKFSELDEGTKNTIVTVGLIIAALGPLLTVLGTLISLVGSALTLAPAISAAIAFISGPIGAVIALVALLAITFYKNWESIKQWTINLFKSIRSTFDNIKSAISNAVNNAVSFVSSAFNQIYSVVTSIVNNVRNAVSSGFNAVVSAISGAINSAISAVSSGFNSIVSTISGAVNSAYGIVSSVFGSISGAVSGAISGITGTVSSVFWGVYNTISSAINSAVGVVQGAVNTIKNAFNFSWSLPHLKVPHISVSGGVAPYGIGGKGSLPRFNISWYRKAYENAVLFNSPTVIPTISGMKGFGDGNGSELVIGTNKLRELVGAAGNNVNVNVYAAPGMNETAVANAVALKLDRWLGERV